MYIVVKGTITVEDINGNNETNKMLASMNNAQFRSCILKIKNTFADNAEDLDIVVPMNNLSGYSDNYFMISGNFWNYYRDEVNDDANENNTAI